MRNMVVFPAPSALHRLRLLILDGLQNIRLCLADLSATKPKPALTKPLCPACGSILLYLFNLSGSTMLNDILPDFQRYLASKNLVSSDKIPFHALWVSKFLAFSNKRQDKNFNSRISMFLSPTLFYWQRLSSFHN